MLIVFAFDSSNINRRNYARSFFCAYLVAIIILIVVLILALFLEFHLILYQIIKNKKWYHFFGLPLFI